MLYSKILQSILKPASLRSYLSMPISSDQCEGRKRLSGFIIQDYHPDKPVCTAASLTISNLAFTGLSIICESLRLLNLKPRNLLHLILYNVSVNDASVTSELQVGALISGFAFLMLPHMEPQRALMKASLLFLCLLLVLLCYHHSH